jgi:hypothetical protein
MTTGRGGNIQVYDQEEQEPSGPTPDAGLWDWHRFSDKNLVEIEEFRPHMPLHNFYEGMSVARDGNVANATVEDAQDRIRAVLEECDHLRSVQALVDMDSSWGGFAFEILSYVSDECPGAVVALFGNDWAYPLADQVSESVFGSPSDVTDRSKMEARRRLNVASSIGLLSDVSSLIIPTGMAVSSLPGSRFPHLNLDRSSCAELGALVATSLDIALSAYRGKSVYEMMEVVTPGMKVVALAASFPHATDADSLLRRLSSDSSSNAPLLEDQYSFLPQLAVGKKHARKDDAQLKVHHRCLTFSGAFASSSYLDSMIESASSASVVAHWACQSPYALPETYRLRSLAGASVDAVTELSLSTGVGAYLDTLATQAKFSDKRVLFEFTRSGMSPDALEELHSTLSELGGAYGHI